MSQNNEFGQPVGDALPDWQPRQHPQRVPLEGRLCRLEPLAEHHAQALFSAYQLAEDTRNWTWLLREPDTNVESYQAWVASIAALQDPIHFAVIDKNTGQPVGSQALVIKGHNRDTDWFSIIDSEWPEIDHAMQKWLAAGNFGPDGKQVSSLESWRQPKR
ncbi:MULTISPECIES: hypothetical protein [Enterobacterales]|uniref:GNAT family N-acetyltransferase n=1 Tax=Enterobacterales TaxID=91347 RepID=UPI002EDAA9E8